MARPRPSPACCRPASRSASAALIGREAVDHLLAPDPAVSELYGMIVLVASSIAVTGLVWQQSRVLQKTGSVAIHGDRTHHLADLVCNLGCVDRPRRRVAVQRTPDRRVCRSGRGLLAGVGSRASSAKPLPS
jgi:hypothetical protein